jgi:rSAM/selenodomain-associated transferase 2
MKLSIIMPVLDEAAGIEAALAALAPYRARGVEVVVVDGGSRDDTPDLAHPLADHVIAAKRGRAIQMNAGAATTQSDVLLFLHADTRLPDNADFLITDGLARSGRAWGRFDVRIDGGGGLLGLVAFMMNWRSRISGIVTGDHAIFVQRAAFENMGGYPAIALMEDVALSTRLKRISRPLALRARVTTSARRWRQHGTLRTMLLMWRLRLSFFLGADPAKLARQYGYAEH